MLSMFFAEMPVNAGMLNFLFFEFLHGFV